MNVTEAMWDQIKDSLYITKAQYLEGLAGWNIEVHRVEGEVVGAVLTKGCELHFTTFGKKWSLTRKDIRDYLVPIIEKYGCVKTKTPKEDERQKRFNTILGFVTDGEDKYFTHYRLDKLR